MGIVSDDRGQMPNELFAIASVMTIDKLMRRTTIGTILPKQKGRQLLPVPPSPHSKEAILATLAGQQSCIRGSPSSTRLRNSSVELFSPGTLSLFPKSSSRLVIVLMKSLILRKPLKELSSLLPVDDSMIFHSIIFTQVSKSFLTVLVNTAFCTYLIFY